MWHFLLEGASSEGGPNAGILRCAQNDNAEGLERWEGCSQNDKAEGLRHWEGLRSE
jgi:hypothetical protein